MDVIGSSSGLLSIFLLIYGLPFLLFIFSLILWGYKRFKHLAMASYVFTVVLSILLIVNNIRNIISYIPWNSARYQMCLSGSILMGMDVVIVCYGIYLYRKNRIVSNILINICSLLAVIIWFSLIKMVNMY